LDTTILSPYQDILLNKLQYQGNNNDCGPFTVATVINSLLGLEVNAAELASEMDRPVWRGPKFIIRRVPHWATFPWGMVDIFRNYGLLASWQMFNHVEDLWDRLSGGYILMPILGNWLPLWAHVMALVKWDPNQGWGFANTQKPDHQISWLSDSQFRAQWQFIFRTLVEVQYN
jgi:hypothetical protein